MRFTLNLLFISKTCRKPKLAEKSSPILPGKIASRTERRRNMEKNKEKKPLEDLMAERERKKNKAGNFEILLLVMSYENKVT